MKTRYLSFLLVLLVGTVACEVEYEPEYEEISSEIQGGTVSGATPWSVALGFNDGFCSGIVLTERWILTAAHCIESTTTSIIISASSNSVPATIVYPVSGTGSFYALKHPTLDIALLYLNSIGQPGVNLSITQKADIYIDSREPWYGNPAMWERGFSAIGWGLGTGGCSGGAGIKRTGDGFMLQLGSRFAEKVDGNNGPASFCNGDSGAPWTLWRGPGGHMAFAVHNGRYYEFPFSTPPEATLIKPQFDWIYQTSKSLDPTRAIVCPLAGYRGGYSFAQCNEIDVTPYEPPPPPPHDCDTGEICCEYGFNGECDLCISPGAGQHCP